MPALLLSCLAYLSVALPGSTLGLLWPSIRLSFGAREINWMHASYGLGATVGPLLVTAMLTAGWGWRRTFAVMALVPGVLGESGAGVWGYLFLTAGRGLPAVAAGVAVSAYWGTMCVGRVVLGPVAQRLGAGRVLAVAVAGVPLGAALMTLPIPGPGNGALAVAGLMLLGLAVAPVFPLTLTTGTTRMVSLQVAASAAGTAALPAGLGLAIGTAGARVLGPSLLVLGLAMAVLFLIGRPGRAASPVSP